jgi:hypothetical protein
MASTAERNWGAEEWRQPVAQDTDTVLYSECGRILNNVDFRSHSFKLVKHGGLGYSLLVRHGAGDERVFLGFAYRGIEAIFKSLDSDSRYLLLNTLLNVKHDAERAARENTAKEYRQAFVDGRLKKRKQRGQGSVKVWIEPAHVKEVAA